ncbi:capsular exopolysaccharide synthesis family protein [Actinopolymorpha cephalotaxi]|nr:capsular exopolysaccharide synthesis family protein [Actinopolymorpha cephalotaxi]
MLLAIAASAAATMQMTPKYASTVRMFVSAQSGDTVDAYQGSLLSEQRVASYADIVTGPEIARRVVDRLDLDESPSALSGQIRADVASNTIILRITVLDADPRRAQRLATAVATEFTSFVQRLETPPGKKQPPIKASVLGTPETPRSPVEPTPIRNLGIGAVLGLLLGIGAAALRDSLDTSIRRADDLNQLVGAPNLSSMPFDPAAGKLPIITDLSAGAPRVEAFRVLRTNLQFTNVDQPSKVFVITSSVPDEGKTSTSCNLAIALAQAGSRVALVEGDLRRPRVAEYLGLEPAVGLTTVLIGRVALTNALQEWGTPGLSVLTSGEVPPDPAELLQSKAMAGVIEELRRSFDVVLIDAPPLLPVTDGALLAAQAHGALLVVRFGRTTRDQVRSSVERLDSVHARLVGTVLNRCPQRDNAGSYGYSYSYSSRTPKKSTSRSTSPDAKVPTPADRTLDAVGGRRPDEK